MGLIGGLLFLFLTLRPQRLTQYGHRYSIPNENRHKYRRGFDRRRLGLWWANQSEPLNPYLTQGCCSVIEVLTELLAFCRYVESEASAEARDARQLMRTG